MTRKTSDQSDEHCVVFVSYNQYKYPSYEHVVQMQTQETGSQWIINPVLPNGHALGHISITVTPHGDVLLLQPPMGFSGMRGQVISLEHYTRVDWLCEWIWKENPGKKG